MFINQIVAVDANYGIGKDNKLPWPNNSEDMRLFKTLTIGNTVVMGKNTLNSLPNKKLKNRFNICVSSNGPTGDSSVYPLTLVDGVQWIKNIDELSHFNRNLWIIGGAKLYESSLDITNRVYMVTFNESYECDTFYPYEKMNSKFKLLDSIKYSSFLLNIYIYIYIYQKN